MYKKFLFLTSVLVLSLAYASYADTTPPTPDPMVWHTPPFPSGPSKIIMRARTATDTETPPVQYYFECTNHGEFSSAWQDSNTYTATGLTPNTTYSFRAKARDSAAPPNETGWSLTLSADTNAVTTPLALKLDFGNDSNTETTELGFRPFTIATSGREVNDVNNDFSGVVIDLSGSITSKRLPSPYYTPTDSNHEQLYRDSISGFPSTGQIIITLWGLGVDRDCNITIYTYDASAQDGNRIADWNSNGTYLFTTNFKGGMTVWPFKPAHPGDYSWKAKATTDYLGRIVLKSWRNPNSFANQPYAYCNALVIEPNSSTTVVQTKYAHRPQPVDEIEGVDVNVNLTWTKGADVETHDIYFGEDKAAVTAATRDVHPGLLIYAPDLAADANQSYDPYGPASFLEFNKTYYWRVDENPDSYKGEVWSFTTEPNSNIVAGDLNGDYAVDYLDLKIITDHWLADCTEPNNCGGADFEPTDGVVNLYDFSDFAMWWLWGPPTCDEGFTIPPMPSYSSLPTNSYLPDPFRFMNVARMTTKAQWTCRRAEIAALAQEFEFGYKQDTPYSATTGDFNSSLNSLTVTVTDNGHQISFACSITYPSTGSAPYPAMIGCGNISLDTSVLSSLGVAVINFPSDQIAQEDSASSRGKGLFYDMYGSSHSAGALMAWAWGMDRLIDAIEKTPDANIDPTRLGVTGCSRWGKGALACGAFDERIKLTIPQESGSGGAASWRISDWQAAQGTGVQTLGEITGENCWFRANFNQFNSTATKLPFDHHEIEGLCAPRALLIIENSSMVWLGNVSTWTTGNVAHKIWEALGIPDKMGYSSDGTHGHCAFPSAQQPEVTAYVQKFLVGGGTGDTNVMKTDGGVTYNESQWVNWTVPALQ
jgi:hypothetical protein